MTSLTIALISFACIATGSVVGAVVRRMLPGHHLTSDSRDVVKLGAGLIATQAALVVGLLVSSAKGSLDSMNTGLTQMGAKIIVLDHTLARCGPGADPVRRQLKATIADGIQRLWPETGPATGVAATEASTDWATVVESVHRLEPANDAQSQALQIASDLTHLRFLLLEQTHTALPRVFLVVLVFWFTVLFCCFAALTPPNPTVFVVLLVCALSVAGAIFLILEMGHPLEGLVRASPAPLEAARDRIGR
ncbi:MAG: hypothetical protein J0L78_06920 [Planctomycetes bacterium]|nr:hypothetical protein [Planctomycetota bacterium]